MTTFEIRPNGQLTVTRDPGYNGADDFVFVEIVGWEGEAGETEKARKFLTALAVAQEVAFGSRVSAWI